MSSGEDLKCAPVRKLILPFLISKDFFSSFHLLNSFPPAKYELWFYVIRAFNNWSRFLRSKHTPLNNFAKCYKGDNMGIFQSQLFQILNVYNLHLTLKNLTQYEVFLTRI